MNFEFVRIAGIYYSRLWKISKFSRVSKAELTVLEISHKAESIIMETNRSMRLHKYDRYIGFNIGNYRSLAVLLSCRNISGYSRYCAWNHWYCKE